MPLSSDLLEPIAGSNPAGANVRYEPVYDQIKQARHEDPDLPRSEGDPPRKTADYALAMKLATEVLEKRSKDLQVAAWLTEALVRREGFPGLKQGLELLHGLMERFWDHVYPEIDDGDLELRAAPLQWVGGSTRATAPGPLELAVKAVPVNASGHSLLAYREGRAFGYESEAEDDPEKASARAAAIEARKPTPEDFDDAVEATPKAWYKQLVADIDDATAALGALDAFCAERFGDVAPTFKPLREAIDEVRRLAAQLLAAKLEKDPDPPEPIETVSEGLGVGEGEGGGTAEGKTGGGGGGGISPMPKSREDAAARVAAAARFMRQESPADPGPYLMLRGLRWGELRAGGGRLDPKLLAAPPTEVRTRLKTFLLDGRWRELLEAAEDVMATPYGRGWLDLQRYVLTACEALGAEFESVGAAVRGALRSLLQDLPELPDLTLMDDSPTANAETRAWLRDSGILAEAAAEEEAAADGAAASAAQASVERRSRLGRDPYDIALQHVRAGQPNRGVELLMREAAQEKSERARFLRRSQAARIMVEAGLEAVAVPILREMVEQIDRHSLEDWEAGDTVAQPLGLLYRCLRKLDEDSSTAEELYLRVCRLDPLQAIQFTNSAPGGDDGPGD